MEGISELKNKNMYAAEANTPAHSNLGPLNGRKWMDRVPYGPSSVMIILENSEFSERNNDGVAAAKGKQRKGVEVKRE
jgi:hypothetical protein